MSQATYTWTLQCKDQSEAEGIMHLLENIALQLSLKMSIIYSNIIVLSKRTSHGWQEVISATELRSINEALAARVPFFE
jgi:hypothetical protein